VGHAIEDAVGQDGIVEQGDPFLDGAVGSEDRGGGAVPLDEDIVEVAGLLGAELAEAEVVEDEQVGGEPGPELALDGVVGPGLPEGQQELGSVSV
jgi:hypothetical protein